MPQWQILIAAGDFTFLALISNIFVKNISISSGTNILANPIEYIQGVSTLRGDMLRKELEIFTFNDLLNYFPLRHVDKTKVDKIGTLNFNTDYAQVAGKITDIEIVGEKRSRRLVAHLQDETGEIELVWFQGINGF